MTMGDVILGLKATVKLNYRFTINVSSEHDCVWVNNKV